MSDIPEDTTRTDVDEASLAKKKLIAYRRAERRLRNRLADLEWEYRELRPEVQSFQKQITVTGQLPEFVLVHDVREEEED